MPSVFHIRAYVDADGSATFTAGDDAIADVTITLISTASGATGVDATTDAEGLATFESVAPGGYVATLSGATPAGAVLATAASLGAVAPFEGDTLDTEFRFAYMPGVVTGIVFRDDDDDGVFTAGSDLTVAGMRVELFAGADADTTTAESLYETTTAADGTYALDRVRKGTYTLRITPPFATMDIEGGRLRNIDVTPSAETSIDAVFSGNAILTIAQARTAANGTDVTVEGVVVAASGTYRAANDNAYIQDPSGGLQIFDIDPAVPLALGDSVRVSGLMGAFAQEREIVRYNATTRPTVVRLATGRTVPAPRVVTVAELNGLTFEGQLARIQGTVTVVGGGTGASYNVTFQQGGTNYIVRVDTPVGATVLRAGWTVGQTYTVTGVISNFNATAQLKPRNTGDRVQP